MSMDVRPPLKHGKRLRTPKGDRFFVSFKYERLSFFFIHMWLLRALKSILSQVIHYSIRGDYPWLGSLA